MLVVEDNDEVRHAVVDMLTGWGYRVVAAENPDVAGGHSGDGTPASICCSPMS